MDKLTGCKHRAPHGPHSASKLDWLRCISPEDIHRVINHHVQTKLSEGSYRLVSRIPPELG